MATKQPELKKRKSGEAIPQLEERETEETCQDHMKEMKKEMAKSSNKTYGLISSLMEATYRFQHQNILAKTISVNQVLEDYPALQLVSEVCTELTMLLQGRLKDTVPGYCLLGLLLHLDYWRLL